MVLAREVCSYKFLPKRNIYLSKVNTFGLYKTIKLGMVQYTITEMNNKIESL